MLEAAKRLHFSVNHPKYQAGQGNQGSQPILHHQPRKNHLTSDAIFELRLKYCRVVSIENERIPRKSHQLTDVLRQPDTEQRFGAHAFDSPSISSFRFQDLSYRSV